MGWSIRQAAEQTGLSIDTLRYYDKEGLVSPKRGGNRYREYEEKDIAALKNIIVMKYAHFSIAEIKSMEALFGHTPSADCNEISREMLTSKIGELRQMIDNYRKIVSLIEEVLPMIESSNSYRVNSGRIDIFIDKIFRDIRDGSSQVTSPPLSEED